MWLPSDLTVHSRQALTKINIPRGISCAAPKKGCVRYSYLGGLSIYPRSKKKSFSYTVLKRLPFFLDKCEGARPTSGSESGPTSGKGNTDFMPKFALSFKGQCHEMDI